MDQTIKVAGVAFIAGYFFCFGIVTGTYGVRNFEEHLRHKLTMKMAINRMKEAQTHE